MRLAPAVAIALLVSAATAGAAGPPLPPPRVESLQPRVVDLPPRVVDTGPGSARDGRVTVPSDVLFAFDRAALGEAAWQVLDGVIPLIERAPDRPVGIVGHTDAIGDTDYNLRLSRRRAAAVRRYLTARVRRSYRAVGAGESQPVAPNADPDGRRRNRRVVIVLPR